jgi:hypothetical protein
MSETLLGVVHYPLRALINGIGRGRNGLSDIQRPFVCANASVRDQFGSMYCDYARLSGCV